MKKKGFVLLMAVMMSSWLVSCGSKQAEVSAPTADSAAYSDDAETETDSHQEAASASPISVLLGGADYPGMSSLEETNDYKGGYLYSAKTDDGIAVIINCAFCSDQDDSETIEDYYARCATEISNSDTINDFTIDQNDELSAKLSYQAYIIRFTTGSNEETHVWDMLIFSTDTHTYAYTYSIAADFIEDREELFDEDIKSLHLE